MRHHTNNMDACCYETVFHINVCQLEIARNDERIFLTFFLNLNEIQNSLHIMVAPGVFCASAIRICCFTLVALVQGGDISLIVF